MNGNNQGRRFNNYGPPRGGYRNGNPNGPQPLKPQTQTSNMNNGAFIHEKENRPDNNQQTSQIQ